MPQHRHTKIAEIYAPSGIRTHDPSIEGAKTLHCLRPCGQRVRHIFLETRYKRPCDTTVEISIHEHDEHTKLHETIASCLNFHVSDCKYFRSVWTEDKGHVHTFLQRCRSQTKHPTRVFGNIISYHGHSNLCKQINIFLGLRIQSVDPVLHILLSVCLSRSNSSLSCDRSIVSSKLSSPKSAILSFLLQLPQGHPTAAYVSFLAFLSL
jgi:hypothetical protein